MVDKKDLNSAFINPLEAFKQVKIKYDLEDYKKSKKYRKYKPSYKDSKDFKRIGQKTEVKELNCIKV